MKTAIYLGWREAPASEEVLTLLKEDFEVRYAQHCSFHEAVDQERLVSLQADFLFNFGPVIIQEKLLKSCGIAPINFHTAPPDWPGRGSCSFALYHGDRDFGVTAHIMDKALDSGPILKVLRFPIELHDTVESLHEKTLQKIPELVKELIADLKRHEWKPLPVSETWAKKALRQKDLMQLMEIHEDDSAGEIARKIRAFAHSSKPGPYVVKNGLRFWYLKNP